MSKEDAIIAACIVLMLVHLVSDSLIMAAQLGEERMLKEFWRDECMRMGGNHERARELHRHHD